MTGADPAAAGRCLAARFGLAGPILTPVTACASGGHALAWAAGLVRRGTVDVALVGAAEASLHPLVLGGYRRMGVLAEAGDDPATAVRPFSATRRGFAVGEGAGVLVLESRGSAARRDVRPLAHLAGWATGCHAAGLTDTETEGRALARLIRDALARAGAPADAVDYVHAHGTATRANDVAEARAVRAAFGRAADRVSVSSTKGAHGHLLGAAAAVETVLTVLAIGRSCVPPTVNLTDPDPAVDLDCTPVEPRPRRIRRAVKVAAGFGGQMVALVLEAPDGEPA
jgi:3-oxoacyl-(acyl-carrier-protein) synthase